MSPLTNATGSTTDQLDERLAKALSHPLRQRILQRLNEGGIRSPNELSRELGDPLGNVSYHVRILRELDCVELVRTEQRRGALEHYYRATASLARRRAVGAPAGGLPPQDARAHAVGDPRGARRRPAARPASTIRRSRSTASSSSSTRGLEARSSSCSTTRSRRRCGSRPRAASRQESPVRTGRSRPHRARRPALPPGGVNLRAPDHSVLPSRRAMKTALRWSSSSSSASSTAPGR